MKKKMHFYFAMCIIALLPISTYAYIDPGTGSYIIQVITGLILVCGASVGIYWKSIRSKITGIFKKSKQEK